MKNDNYVVVAGTFDLFHTGHVELLRRASQFGKVIALVNTDRFVKQFKKIEPIINQEDRLLVINSSRYVDYSGLNDESDLTKTLNPIIKTTKITGIVFGDDYNIEKYREQTKITREWQQKYGVALIQLPRTDSISSTEIRHRLK